MQEYPILRSTVKALPLMEIIFAAVVVAVLYWAQAVLIPIALAIFFAFLLNPIVIRLQRWRVPRVVAVVGLTVVVAALVLAIGWLVVSQVTSLAADLPNYTENIKKKMESLETMSENAGWPRLQAMMQDLGILAAPSKPPGPETALPTKSESLPTGVPVVIQNPQPAWLRVLPNVFGPVTELLSQIGLAIVLVIFFLLARDELRNRFIRLVGEGRLTVTTKAVDDASQRLSKFLLAQLTLNVLFGVCTAIGLTLIGVPYALLWGFLAGVLRYVPYVGSWIAAMFPVVLSIAQFESWLQPVLVVALILGLEVFDANVFEPWMFGHSIGVSAVALIVSAAFWAFLWGPIGMVLSCPLTVCLVVLGKYVPHLEFLNILLSDQPALGEDFAYYQRLSARDEDEATDLALEYVKDNSADGVYDALLIPALTYARRDLDRNGLNEADLRFMEGATRNILEDIRDARVQNGGQLLPANAATSTSSTKKLPILGIPVRDDIDALALQMLGQLLDADQFELTIASVDVLTSEALTKIEKDGPVAVCLSAVPPGGLARARLMYKRLKSRFPNVHVVIGRWGLEAPEPQTSIISHPNGDETFTALLAARDHLVAWMPALAEKAGDQTEKSGTSGLESRKPPFKAKDLTSAAV